MAKIIIILNDIEILIVKHDYFFTIILIIVLGNFFTNNK